MTKITPLTKSYNQDAAICLASAFIDDPVLGQHMFRQDAYKASGATTFFSSVIDEQFKTSRHSCVASDNGTLQGVCLWQGPNEPKGVSLGSMIRMLPLAPSIFGYSHIWRVLSGNAAVDGNHPTYKHYYLAYIGVSPNCQGQGIGSALLKPVLKKADAQGIPCYLETGNPKNIKFYEKYGFTVTNEIVVMNKSEVAVGDAPKGAPLLIYCMKRESTKRRTRKSSP
jgi:ribosomal protein S18 acetylase RimI-like enzyme